MASLLISGGSNFRGNFSMYQLQPRRFTPDPPPAPVRRSSSTDMSSSFGTSTDMSSSYRTSPDMSSYRTSPDMSSSFRTSPDMSSSYKTAPDMSSSYRTAPDMSSSFRTSTGMSSSISEGTYSSKFITSSPRVSPGSSQASNASVTSAGGGFNSTHKTHTLSTPLGFKHGEVNVDHRENGYYSNYPPTFTQLVPGHRDSHCRPNSSTAVRPCVASHQNGTSRVSAKDAAVPWSSIILRDAGNQVMLVRHTETGHIDRIHGHSNTYPAHSQSAMEVHPDDMLKVVPVSSSNSIVLRDVSNHMDILSKDTAMPQCCGGQQHCYARKELDSTHPPINVNLRIDNACKCADRESYPERPIQFFREKIRDHRRNSELYQHPHNISLPNRHSATHPTSKLAEKPSLSRRHSYTPVASTIKPQRQVDRQKTDRKETRTTYRSTSCERPKQCHQTSPGKQRSVTFKLPQEEKVECRGHCLHVLCDTCVKGRKQFSDRKNKRDQRRKTGFESSGLSLKGGELSSCTSMPDLRRETVVLSQATPAKNIPIIDDDDETNIDDDEDFFPAYMKSRLPGPATESDRSSSDHDDRRRMRKSDPMGGKSEGPGRRWGSRVSLGVDDKTSSFDLDDTDDLDTWSDTTEVIYPPSDSESVDTYASTYRVFAVEGDKKVHSKRASQIPDDDSESTDQVSLEDQGEDDPNDETLVTSNASTPCDHDRDFMPGTPDKEQFVKENFESVSFTPVAMDKFAQQVATLERAVEDDPSNMPFSPRLSLSSKFLSRSQFGGLRGGGGGGGLGGGQRADNWFDPLRRNKSDMARAMDKSDMARAMDDTRRRLADMNWRTGGLLQESPEKEDPPSPPTRLDNREPSFSTPKAGHTNSNPGLCGSPAPSPRTLRRFWADFTLPHQPIKEENPLPRIPVPLSLNHLKGERLSTSGPPANGSKIPLAQATCWAELMPQSYEGDRYPRISPVPHDGRGPQSPRLIRSHDMKPVGISGGTPPPSPRAVKSGVSRTPGSTPPPSPRLARCNSKSGGGAVSAPITIPPQSPRSCRSRVTSKPPRSPQSPDLRSPQSPKPPPSPMSPKPPMCPTSPRPPRIPLSLRLPRAVQSTDLPSPQSPRPPRSPVSSRSPRSAAQLPELRSPCGPLPPKKPPRSLPPLRSSSSSPSRSAPSRSIPPSPSRSAPPSPSSSTPPSPSPDSSGSFEGRDPPKKPPRTLTSLRSRSKSPQSPSNSHRSSPSPTPHAEGDKVRESVRPCCRSRPTPKTKSSSSAGGKLERDASPIPPASPTRTTPSSPSRGSSPLAGKDKRRSLSAARLGEVNGGSTSSAPPPRQVPSYFRTTKSSRLKTSSAGNLLKTAEVQGNKSSGLQGSKIDGGKKRAGKGRLSSSRLMMYASTPNLAHFQEDDEDMKDATEPEAEPASNLRSLADLSLSVPDINCLDDPAASTDSSSSSSGPTRRDKERSSSAMQMSRPYSPSRRSLPPGGLGGKDLRFSLAQQDGDLTDTNLMPPPAPTMRPAQSSLLRRAGQVRKRSTSELTLEQAKSILLGNSGILGSQNSPEEEQTPTSDLPPSARPSVNSTSSRSSQRTLSSASSTTLRPVSSRTNSSSSRNTSTSSPVFNTSNPAGYTPATTLAVAEEIDRTANELKRERQRAAAAALNASRYDPPERDQPSPQPRKQQESAPSSAAHVSFDEAGSRDDSASGASSGGEESLNLSVRERIARLNHHKSKNGSGEAGRGSLESVRSASPSVVAPAGGRVSTPPVPPEQQVSPRSQSDTGLGSDTDTDSELRQYQQGKQGGEGAGSRGDRSRLSLHLHNSTTPSPTPPSSAASSQEPMLACTRVVADLKSAVQNAKDFHSEQLNSGSKASASSQQMMSIMAEAFHEAHITLAQLALQSPVANDNSDNLKPPSCPLVADSGSGSWNTSVMDKAKDMLQPLMSQLSRELSDELVKVVRDRLEKGGAPR